MGKNRSHTRDPMLITRTLDIALRIIFAHQRRLARRAGALAARTGAITFVQRFGGALNLNVHFHCVIPDGVFVRQNGNVRFVALAPPSDEDVLAVLRRMVVRLERLLRPRLASAEDDARPLDALRAAQAEAMNAPPDTGRPRKLAAYLDGFSLHAAVHLRANDREGLAHLCGYGARPPFSQERLSTLPDGRLAYRLKRPLGDGRQMLLLQPTELLRRLATLVPPPRAHLALAQSGHPAALPRGRTRLPCGGRRVVLAYLTQPGPVKAILDHLGLPSTGPPIAPARLSGGLAEATWQDDVPALQQSL